VAVLANLLIGLREGLEASLVVGILVAYLVRTGRRDRLSAVWIGVGSAIALSMAVGGALSLTATELPGPAEPLFAGLTSVLAVAFVTWMIFWMRRTARSMAGELRGRLDKAIDLGTGALIGTAFLAVAREGLETALFMWSAVQTAGTGASPLLGGLFGLLVSALLGWLVYRRAVRINLASFFTWTGLALVVVAAGVLSYGLGDLQEAGFLPGGDTPAFDVSGTIAPSSVAGTLLTGLFNLSPRMSWLQVAAWLGYLVPVLALFLRPDRSPARVAAQTVPAKTVQQATEQAEQPPPSELPADDGSQLRTNAR
jgi:high-affinity iron transporter